MQTSLSLSSRADQVAGHSYLIIAGTTKGATTSLFQYLGDHPQICLANIKETRFFLEKESLLPAKYHIADGLEPYDEFFKQCSDQQTLRVDATPDYLYSPQAAEDIHANLPHSKIVFALREPISRVVSWYRFAKQNNSLPESITLDEYIQAQLKESHPEQHMRAVEQGRYATYLKPYFELFGAQRIFVTFLEELEQDPHSVMHNLCGFAGIDTAIYKNYEFQIHNRTEIVRSPFLHQLYRKTRYTLINSFHDHTTLRIVFRKIRKAIEPVYIQLNRKASSEPSPLSARTLSALEDYYRSPNAELAEILGRMLPW